MLKKISEIPLDLPLDGNEGLNPNYASRMRTQYLFTQNQIMVTQMQFADAKAAVMITISGIAAFRGPIGLDQIEVTDTFSIAFVATISCAILFCMLSVLPRFPSKKQSDFMVDHELWSWPALVSSKITAQAYSDFMKTAEISQLVHSVSISNFHLAKILFKKFWLLRIGFTFGIVAMICLALKAMGL